VISGKKAISELTGRLTGMSGPSPISSTSSHRTAENAKTIKQNRSVVFNGSADVRMDRNPFNMIKCLPWKCLCHHVYRQTRAMQGRMRSRRNIDPKQYEVYDYFQYRDEVVSSSVYYEIHFDFKGGIAMDQIDKKILFHLQSQARISMTELGRLVGLSQPAVTERVKRLEEKGVIRHLSRKTRKACRRLPAVSNQGLQRLP